MKISEHFTVEEAAFSRSAVVKRIKNEPTDKEIQNIKKPPKLSWNLLGSILELLLDRTVFLDQKN